MDGTYYQTKFNTCNVFVPETAELYWEPENAHWWPGQSSFLTAEFLMLHFHLKLDTRSLKCNTANTNQTEVISMFWQISRFIGT